MSRELEHSALAKISPRNDAHILGILNGHNHTGSQKNLLPSLVDVQNVSAISLAVEHILLLLEVQVL